MLKLTNENTRTLGLGVVKRNVGFRQMTTPPPQSLHFDCLDATEANRKLLKRCQKVVTDLSKTLCSDNGTMHSTLTETAMKQIELMSRKKNLSSPKIARLQVQSL